ncbi:permease of the major facilitator superfamily [Rubidibacter lacunae KORDI 51-2]|uniref:Permease of the major facilitator superfamily n=1 Tax=Rubidibacter lacunae KORDI 51-2 TaxID=582515 RepID=U5DQB4_9CHRO|nr:MFS transporter [Rubidibacter lacunae]ERN41880.1 permease of the major facilitator superfamily [Rubidibacter lacunae KORDI 51-2]
MQTFTIILCGQLVSAIGSSMTFFSLTLWAWENTGSATALALIGLFIRVSQVSSTYFAGSVVDRFNRKHLMILGDAVTASCASIIGLLFLEHALQIWHLYIIGLVVGGFGQIQILAYQASLSLLIPKHQYTRAGSMGAAVSYGSSIIGPALAGILYPQIGLFGIVTIDIATFMLAIVILFFVRIPQPEFTLADDSQQSNHSFVTGFLHVWKQPSLRVLLVVMVLFTFVHDFGGALQSPMVLARTDGDPRALAAVSAAAGFGGVTGAVLTSIWGGPKRRIYGMLGGYIGVGLSKIIFGLGRSLPVWGPAQFCSSLNFPLLGSSREALWMDKISPEIQGRVFAANSLVTQVASGIAILLAGPLADRLFEPAMMSGGQLVGWLGGSFGSGPGAGMAILYTLCSVSILLVGLGGFLLPKLRTIEID